MFQKFNQFNKKIIKYLFITNKIKCNNTYLFLFFVAVAFIITIPNYEFLSEKIIYYQNYINIYASLDGGIDTSTQYFQGNKYVPSLMEQLIVNPSLIITAEIGRCFYIFNILIIPLYALQSLINILLVIINNIPNITNNNLLITIFFIIISAMRIILFLFSIIYQIKMIIFLYYNSYNYIIRYIINKIKK